MKVGKGKIIGLKTTNSIIHKILSRTVLKTSIGLLLSKRIEIVLGIIKRPVIILRRINPEGWF